MVRTVVIENGVSIESDRPTAAVVRGYETLGYSVVEIVSRVEVKMSFSGRTVTIRKCS